MYVFKIFLYLKTVPFPVQFSLNVTSLVLKTDQIFIFKLTGGGFFFNFAFSEGAGRNGCRIFGAVGLLGAIPTLPLLGVAGFGGPPEGL